MAIRVLREGGVTQAELAEEIGVSTSTLQRWRQAFIVLVSRKQPLELDL